MQSSNQNSFLALLRGTIPFVLCFICTACMPTAEITMLTSAPRSELAAQQPIGDGEAIAFSYMRIAMLNPFELYVLDNINGIRSLSHGSTRADIGAVWSPDGTQIVYMSVASGSMRYYLVNADGTERRELTVGDEFKSLPRWSTDGSRLAYIAFDPDADDSSANSPDLCITEVSTGETHRTSAGNIQDMVWMSAESSLLAVIRADDAVTAEVYDLDGNHMRRKSELEYLRDAVFVAIAPDANRIAHISPLADEAGDDLSDHGLYISTLDGETTNAVGAFWIEGAVVWSPDSTRIAFVAYTDDGGDALYVANADGTGLQELMRVNTGDESGEIMAADPAWSPDGTRIAIGSYASPDGSALFVINADGTDLRQITSMTDDGGMFYELAWRP